MMKKYPLAVLILASVSLLPVQAASDAACRSCHNDAEKLAKKVDTHLLAEYELSVEQRVNQLLVEESAMGAHAEASCRDCHQSTQASPVGKWHPKVSSRPTADGGSVCADCHGEELVERFQHSLHYTVNGIAKSLSERLATTPDKQKLFDEIHKDPEEGCATCHATCGSCAGIKE